MLHRLIEAVLPTIISALELIGISIVTAGALNSFLHYLRGALRRRPDNFELLLFRAMAVGLEFKMAAEILKTVLVREFEELLMLGAIILLRALLSLMIHFEMRHAHLDAFGDEPPNR